MIYHRIASMIFLGLYSTAISISQDNQLRKSIKKFATHDSNLLSSIGTAQMDQEIQRTVNGMKQVVQKQEKELEEQTGIEASMADDEMKNYLREVMQEIGKANNKSSPYHCVCLQIIDSFIMLCPKHKHS